jgi:replication initiation protein RepC
MTQHQRAFSYYRSTRNDFPTLPAKIEREGFIELMDQVHQFLGIGNAAFDTFRRMAMLTRPSDWKEPDREPCCYMAQTEIAKLRHVSPARIRAHESELVKAGLIEKRTAANGARSGFVGCGIYFSNCIARFNEFLAIRKASEAQRAAAARLRGLRSTHKKHIKAAITELRDLGVVSNALEDIEAEYLAWPSSGSLHQMSLSHLSEHERQADALCINCLVLLDNWNNSDARPHDNVRPYIQDTTQNSTYVTCNDRVETWPSGKPSETDPKSFGPTGRALCVEKNDEDGRTAHKSEFLEKLSPARVYHLCSPNMQMYLDARLEGRSIRALHFHDFVAAACIRLPELGISQSAWNAAVDAMGQDSATMCVIITDANTQNPNVPVLNPGGYLRGMTRAQQQGKLNIVGGLIGLTERRKQEE